MGKKKEVRDQIDRCAALSVEILKGKIELTNLKLRNVLIDAIIHATKEIIRKRLDCHTQDIRMIVQQFGGEFVDGMLTDIQKGFADGRDLLLVRLGYNLRVMRVDDDDDDDKNWNGPEGPEGKDENKANGKYGQ